MTGDPPAPDCGRIGEMRAAERRQMALLGAYAACPKAEGILREKYNIEANF